jgi:hypothetical protein
VGGRTRRSSSGAMNPYKEYVMRGQKALGLNVKLDLRQEEPGIP